MKRSSKMPLHVLVWLFNANNFVFDVLVNLSVSEYPINHSDLRPKIDQEIDPASIPAHSRSQDDEVH